MFGYVSLGGQKFEAFLWEDEEPNWFDCIILHSREALEQQVVALHFSVPAERVFIDEEVKEGMNVESTAIAEKCRTKLEKGEKIGKRISFDLPAMIDALSEKPEELEDNMDFPTMEPSQLSEADMEFEVEMMLSRMESGTPRVGAGETEFPEGTDFVDGAMLYEAETFGGKFVGDETDEDVGGGLITQASTIKQHLIEQFLDSPQCSLDPVPIIPRMPSMPANFKGVETLAPTIDDDLSQWSMDFNSTNYAQDEPGILGFRPKPVQRVSTAPNLEDASDAELPPMDDEPALLARQPAFVSTRGKEREIWQTYREEITETWRAELEELRRGLFEEAAHMGA